MKKLLICTALLALPACTPTVAGLGAVLEVVGTTYGKINANVQQAAQQLHDNCLLLQSSIAIGQGQLVGNKLQRAVQTGEQALASYCTGSPPVDVPTALQTVARVYREVITAKAIAADATPALQPASR
jgi:hypothetical protein